jgi:hypothetical protein
VRKIITAWKLLTGVITLDKAYEKLDVSPFVGDSITSLALKLFNEFYALFMHVYYDGNYNYNSEMSNANSKINKQINISKSC